MEGYLVPAGHVTREIKVKNSRFIASLRSATDVQSAKEFVRLMEETYPEATHHVPAYIIGHGTSKIMHANDDGEPSGTAGRPALTVLEGSGLGDVVVVIIRYFGGTELGTGGLVRAYSDAVRAVLEITPKAKKGIAHLISITTPYPFYEPISRIAKQHQAVIKEEIFTSDVKMTLAVPVDAYMDFRNSVLDITSGAVLPKIVEKNRPVILPLSTN
ncbi:MAG: YigZ family protein [Anaerolineales bacterium]